MQGCKDVRMQGCKDARMQGCKDQGSFSSGSVEIAHMNCLNLTGNIDQNFNE